MPSPALAQWTPGWARNAVKRLLGLPVYEAVEEGQKGSDFYDRTFDEDDYWRSHYTTVHDYVCWTVIIDRLRTWRVRRLLEIGCGSGQLACAIRDAGILEDYCGFDFSAHRLGYAKSRCPELRFEVADAFKTDLLATFDYDSALATEFLEHVEDDLLLLSRLRPRTKFIGTVPNYPFVSHVRHFTSCEDVSARYASMFEDFSVHRILLNEQGKSLFILQGVRSDGACAAA
jgi:SAM-dependent methyltransferase